MRWRSIISSFTVFVLIFSLGIQQAFAAPLTSVSDTLSDDLINNTSDHTIQFTFPTGRYITDDVFYIDFDANFTMAGAWATSDFSTINEDGTEGGFNSWNVFEVDTVDPSGACFMYTDGDVAVVYDNDANRLKFKFCNDGSSVAPQTNAVITFTIYGTGGNGTLTNPSSAGV